MKPLPGVKLSRTLASLTLLWPAAAFAGAIGGTAVFEGQVPELQAVNMNADEVCLHKHDVPPQTEVLVVGEGNALANVFVHVTGGLPDKEYPVPEEPVVLDQVGCIYVPHVFGVRANQPLQILNPDGVLHNVHAFCKKNQQFNLAMPKFKKKTTKVFKNPEFMFPIKCDVHPWMGSWCAVMDHPFFAVTDSEGKFNIDGLPVGTYEIEAWHEKLGVQKATFTIGVDKVKSMEFKFSADG